GSSYCRQGIWARPQVPGDARSASETVPEHCMLRGGYLRGHILEAGLLRDHLAHGVIGRRAHC
ncbi:MAG: hypothetical protein AAFN92_18950, partial [Bacteroidota bacterium]